MLLLALLIAVVSARPLQALPPHHADGGKPLASLPSCNGCFTGFNGVDYACCNDMTFNNGVCSCSGGTPCTQCAPSPKDKQKVFPLLPSCGGCYSGVNGVDYTCSDCNISINNGQCVCGDGSACLQCGHSSASRARPHNTKAFQPEFSYIKLTLKDLSVYQTSFPGWSGSCIASAPDWYCSYGTGFTLQYSNPLSPCAQGYVSGQAPFDNPAPLLGSCLCWSSNDTAVAYASVAAPAFGSSTLEGYQWMFEAKVIQ